MADQIVGSTASTIWDRVPPIGLTGYPGLRIGVLALQGSFLEHSLMLRRLGVDVVEVRTPDQLKGINGLILPGGESTTISTLIGLHGFRDPILEVADAGMPIWGTCAGMILLARSLTQEPPVPLRLINIDVSRNAFGRQLASFEAPITWSVFGAPPFPGIFIRAPSITDVDPEVEILASILDEIPVAARQMNIVVSSFHPELTTDDRFHRYFIDMVKEA
jgi:5'-phosphate synthase pdxT subunit